MEWLIPRRPSRPLFCLFFFSSLVHSKFLGEGPLFQTVGSGSSPVSDGGETRDSMDHGKEKGCPVPSLTEKTEFISEVIHRRRGKCHAQTIRTIS